MRNQYLDSELDEDLLIMRDAYLLNDFSITPVMENYLEDIETTKLGTE